MTNIIKYTDWSKLAQYDLSNEHFEIPYENCTVFVPQDNITEFFRRCHKLYNYTVISASSDYGVHYQQESPVDADMIKWMNMMINGNMPKLGYNPLIIPSRCNLERCKITDKYSVKMYSYTQSTFDRIPNNVTWYSTNANIEGVIQIPFGVPEWSAHLLDWVGRDQKEQKLYVNFQLNNVERLMLWRGLNVDWAVKEDTIPHEQYVERIKKYLFILCPEGNGLDSYRILETLYCGSIPVVLNAQWNQLYKGLPVIFVDDWRNLSYEFLMRSLEKIWDKELNYVTDLTYWKNKFVSK